MKYRTKVKHPLTGKQFRLTAPTRRKLEQRVAHVDDLREALRLGTKTDTEVAQVLSRLRGRRPVTLEQAARSYLERPTLAANTRRRTESVLATHLAELAPRKLLELTGAVLAPWMDALCCKVESSTARMVWWTLRAIGRHALERGMVDVVPWSAWRPRIRGLVDQRPKREAARHVGELWMLLEAAANMDAVDGGSLEAKIAAAALLGLRQGELAGLRWNDIDFARQAVRIARGADGPTKGRRIDVLRADPGLFDVLHAQRLRVTELHLLYRADGPVFPCPWRSSDYNPRPYPPRSEVLRTADLREAVALAGLPDPERWSPHSLRDTFVTLEAAASDGDLRALADRTRHRSLVSLERYLRARTREPAPPRMLLEGRPRSLPPGRGVT